MGRLMVWGGVSVVIHAALLAVGPLAGAPVREGNTAPAAPPQMLALTLTTAPKTVPQPLQAAPLPEPVAEPVPAPPAPAPPPRPKQVVEPVAERAPAPQAKPQATPQPIPRSATPAPAPAPAPAASPAPPPMAPAAPVTQQVAAAAPVVVRDPEFLNPPRPPDYPPTAVRRHQEGIVIVRALVTRPGRPEDIVVWQSSGHSLLDAAALEAVAGWQFRPSVQNGALVAAWVEVPVSFLLN